jgi:hypothetical protein
MTDRTSSKEGTENTVENRLKKGEQIWLMQSLLRNREGQKFCAKSTLTCLYLNFDLITDN